MTSSQVEWGMIWAALGGLTAILTPIFVVVWRTASASAKLDNLLVAHNVMDAEVKSQFADVKHKLEKQDEKINAIDKQLGIATAVAQKPDSTVAKNTPQQ